LADGENFGSESVSRALVVGEVARAEGCDEVGGGVLVEVILDSVPGREGSAPTAIDALPARTKKRVFHFITAEI
jgi:hypothetical protein